MATTLLDTLRKADLDQVRLSLVELISMQDYSRLGVTTMKDRRKLFQLVQGLRQELPSYENGLLATSHSTAPSTLRRPSEIYQKRPDSSSPTRSPIQSPSIPSPPPLTTRSRSRTLPGQFSRPEIQTKQLDTYHEDVSDEEDDPVPVRRGSGPSNPYGMPLHAARVRNSRRPASTSSASSTPIVTALPITKPGQSDLNQKIRVCVRKRPLSRKEIEKAEKDIAPTVGIRSININEPNFTFDELYQRTALPLVKYIFGGGKATCFAYGQTGSGKTYTMLDPDHGLYVLAARDIFALLKLPQYEHLSAWIGFYEIYQGQLYDLLNERKKLFAREDGKQNVVISGLQEFPIDNVNNLMQVFEYGSQARSTGNTGANADSSRSHAILQVLLKPKKNRKQITGKLSFIDLAGSERGADRGDADTKTRMEGAEINKSLLALKECIRALDQDKRHTPFRQSKLTQVLKDSFVGKSRTCMIATISPNQSNSEHTLNTLRYADRVKELKGERSRPYSENLSDENYMTSGYNDIGMDEISGDDDEEQFLDDDFVESDDPDLYKEEDDTFLDDEDFPDANVNILDEEFMLDGNDRLLADPPAALPPQNTYSAQHIDSVMFDADTIDDFIKLHRAEVREVSDYTKKETKLLANFSLGLSSRRNLQEGETPSVKDDIKTSSEFIDYLGNLDEVLDMKMAAIEALRDRIRLALGEDAF
ncbi:P-loop containing nucleoside triphosphate hydrolase protein [Umbelopsis sp. PMI_123]|nr:P-loop containing nucleoside triphosphate hydrolase protein [Umbelopsis sp. PMI_123]